MSDENEIERKISEPDDKDAHPDYGGVLTWGDVRRAQKKAQEAVNKAQKQELLDRIEETHERNLLDAMGETERFRKETQNLTPVNREMVELTLALPPQMPDIRIDGQVYRDRGTFKVTRAKATEMQRIQFEGWRHESVRKGDDSYAFYAQMNQQNRSPVVVNMRSGIMSGAMPRGTH